MEMRESSVQFIFSYLTVPGSVHKFYFRISLGGGGGGRGQNLMLNTIIKGGSGASTNYVYPKGG